MRFKAKCERFMADRLREQMTADSRNAERYATEAILEFLFDHGLNPLFDVDIAGLRPDVLEPTSPRPLYIEVKQYSKGSPKTVIQKALTQVWETWNRVDSTCSVREAFLLVFRIGGPLVLFEDTVTWEGRTLHPVLVDIAPSDEAGSRAREKSISFVAADLLPRPGTSA